jgi:plasmid stabilization system protein ParE
MNTYSVIFSSGAREDIAELAEYLASKSSPEISGRYIEGLILECESLSLTPHRGTKRSDLRPNMRVIGHQRSAAIVFRIEEDMRAVVILAVMYRGLKYQDVLARED